VNGIVEEGNQTWTDDVGLTVWKNAEFPIRVHDQQWPINIPGRVCCDKIPLKKPWFPGDFVKTALNPRSSGKLQYEGREIDCTQCCWFRSIVEARATCINTRELLNGWMTLEIRDDRRVVCNRLSFVEFEIESKVNGKNKFVQIVEAGMEGKARTGCNDS